MESNRQRKFCRLIQKELAAIFQKDFSIPGGVMVTVSVVRTTADLAVARTYISVFPVDKRAQTVEFLNENVKEVRKFLGKNIRQQVRHIPNLQFFEDDSLDHAERIDDLLDKFKDS